MRKMAWTGLSIITCALIFVGSEARLRADVIFTNLGPGQSFDTVHFWNVGTVTAGQNQAVAFSFAPTETATLTDTMLALQQFSGSGAVSVYVESNSGGQPGTILDSLAQVGSVPTSPALVEYTCATCSVLQSGTTYWLVAVQSDPATLDGWDQSLTETGTWYFNLAGSSTGPWVQTSNPFSAFQVDGTVSTTPVPEPGNVLLFATGLGGLLMMGARRLVQRVAPIL